MSFTSTIRNKAIFGSEVITEHTEELVRVSIPYRALVKVVELSADGCVMHSIVFDSLRWPNSLWVTKCGWRFGQANFHTRSQRELVVIGRPCQFCARVTGRRAPAAEGGIEARRPVDQGDGASASGCA